MKEEMWKAIPLLHIYDETMDEQTPVVIFMHGFLSAKEHNLHYAYQLVKKGIRVILPDALMHGQRGTNLTENQMSFNFWKIVLKSVEEVHTLYEELKLRGILTTDRIGIAGTSMGGIVTSGCLAIYPWVYTAGICMGTTSYTKLAAHQVEEMKAKGVQFPLSGEQQQAMIAMLERYNMENHCDVWAQRPIIFWHGERDSVVPYPMSRAFYEELVTRNEAEHIDYIAEKKAGHAVSRDGILQVTSFLAQHLA